MAVLSGAASKKSAGNKKRRLAAAFLFVVRAGQHGLD